MCDQELTPTATRRRRGVQATEGNGDEGRDADPAQIRIGFARKGTVVLLLPMLPHLLFLVLTNPSPPNAVTNDDLMLDVLEHGSRVACAALLMFLVGGSAAPMSSRITVAMAGALFAYFGP